LTKTGVFGFHPVLKRKILKNWQKLEASKQYLSWQGINEERGEENPSFTVTNTQPNSMKLH
jgi:hypothetical protein